jgi:hypothetical protein
MSKKELIEYICELNKSARREFLENFSEKELTDYLDNLMKQDFDKQPVCC